MLNFAAIIDQSGTGFMTINDEGKIISWNKRATEIFGYTKSEVLGKSPELLNIESDPSPFTHIIEEIKQSGRLIQFEAQKKSKSGAQLDLMMSAAAIRADDSQKLLFVLTFDDLTIRNELTDHVIYKEKLTGSVEAINRLLATLSHYINNSLMSIQGLIQLVDLDTKFSDEFLRVTRIQTNRIAAVIQSLGELTRHINMKTKDYAGNPDVLYDLELLIDEFTDGIRKRKSDERSNKLK
jgi:PAS domain S-box-containing protein